MAKTRFALVPAAALMIVLGSHVVTGAMGSTGLNAGSTGDLGSPPGNPPGVVQDPSRAVSSSVDNGFGPGAGAVDTSDTDRRIAFWQGRIKANPTSDSQYQYLGQLFARKGRQTGDINQYTLAGQAFQKAIELYPGSVAARTGLAVNLVTLHDWSNAIEQGKTILETDPRAIGAVAVIGDASLETGDLDTAQAAFGTLRQKVDSPAVESRFARLAFLTGKSDEAIRILDDAATTSVSLNGSAEEQAFYQYSAGQYRFDSGDVDGAEREFEDALRAFPNYYLAIAGRGRVAFARGDLAAAIGFYRAAVAIIPKPELVAYLGDLYALNGDRVAAEAQYKTVDFIVRLNAVQAQVFSREIAQFQATHHRDTAHAVAIARAELETRKDIYGYDTLAWALYNDGQPSDALAPAQQAVSLGTQDPKLLYHLGMIELATGHPADGQAHLRAALALNPAFDPLGAAAARAALGR